MGWTKWNGLTIEKKMQEAIMKAQNDTAEIVLKRAKREVPLDERTLKASGTIVQFKNEATTAIAFGGGAGTGIPIIPYAIRWHENSANFQHGRKRFYLKDPFYKRAPKVYPNAIKKRLGEIL